MCLIIQSKTKRKLLKLFLLNKNKKFHVRELSRLVDEPLSAIQRELKKLLDLELITKVPEKGVINYYVNTELGYFNDLKNVEIEVDGGIKADNAKDAFNAGANILVSGTGVFKGNIIDNIKIIRNAVNMGS